MTRAIEHIDQDLAALEKRLHQLAEELSTLYRHYLETLADTTRRQLILASYHLCTQGYATQFLNLSLSERQALQQALQQLARQAQCQIVAQLDPSAPEDGLDGDEETEAEARGEEAGVAGLMASSPPDTNAIALVSQPERVLTPTDLLEWQEEVEEAIAITLQEISHAANRLLQQNQILPSQLPEPVLEVAAKAGMATETTAPPNLLNLIVETENEDEESSITHLMTIRLRLTEIEFSDAHLTAYRGKIRTLGGGLSQLRQDYHRRQREKAIAEAEAAWRASWYEK
jgi:hypothetical protein